jgi:hypothetical protein
LAIVLSVLPFMASETFFLTCVNIKLTRCHTE